jgi:hypothetical protein
MMSVRDGTEIGGEMGGRPAGPVDPAGRASRVGEEGLDVRADVAGSASRLASTLQCAPGEEVGVLIESGRLCPESRVLTFFRHVHN